MTDPPSAPPSRGRTWRASAWTLAGYGFQQALRFGSNLILARLLVPQAFGLMALVQVVITGLEMFSDLGLGPAIIQSPRGENPLFLRTAWSLQVLRGFVLAGVGAALAWPAAAFYGQPELKALIPAATAGLALRGLGSMRLFTLNRRVLLGRLTALDTGTYALGVAFMLAAAWTWHSVWALVLGSLVGAAAKTLLSHLVLPGAHDGLAWDRASLGELTRIGRWIFVSTAATFLVGNLDRLVLGRLVDIDTLGIYSVALQLAIAAPLVGRTLGSRVFFPVLAETLRQDPAGLPERLRKIRIAWTLPICGILLVLALAGEPIVRLLYPARLHDAGWVLRVLAAGGIAAVVNQSTGLVWSPLGEFRCIALLMMAQIPVLFLAMFIGHAFRGAPGAIVGIALVEAAVYPIQAALAWRRGLWQPALDLPLLGIAGLIVLGGFLAF